MLQTDDKILKIITANPCLTQSEVAKKAGVTRDTCRRAEERLRKEGRLKGRGYVLPSASDSLRAPLVDPKVIVFVGSPSDAHEVEKFEAFLTAQKNIGRILMVTGDDDYVVLCKFSVDSSEFNEFVSQIRSFIGKETSSHVVARVLA